MPDIESSRIEVPARLADVHADLTGHSQRLQQELDDLAPKLAVLQTDWTGDAAGDYKDVQSLWDSDATALFDPHDGVLKRIAEAMAKVSDNYDVTQATIRQTWRSF